MARFTDKVVLITGAAGGFGAGAAEAFAAEGAKLVLSDIRAEALDPVVAALKAKGVAVIGLAADVGKSADHTRLVQAALETFGRLDIALNNAGIAHANMKLQHIPDEVAERVVQVDLMGVFYAMKAQIPVMEKQGGGAIVNIASAAGIGAAPLISAYAAAKHGVVGLTKTAAIEVARKNIRVNAICPAFAATNMVLDLIKESPDGVEAATARLVQAVPMRRLGHISEVVEAILFAASPGNSFMTGQMLSVDGGLSAL